MPPCPVLLQPDNFTPAARTPWGGRRIVEDFKPFLSGRHDDGPVGESWELSSTPELPSRTLDGRSLPELLAGDPEGWLGPAAGSGNALLVKLLDAAEHLSLQIHPDDGYPGLAPDEGGKPEAWYVVGRAPGAGIYLGFSPGVDRARIEEVIAQGADLSGLMGFLEVSVGDFVVLDPGTPHAVGAGVTLIEPQRVSAGRRGVTYRYWDWNRRYDADGKASATGATRALHLEHALAVTDWARATDPEALRARLRHHPLPPLSSPATWTPLCGPGADEGLHSEHLRVSRLTGTGALSLPAWPQLRGLTVIAGRVSLSSGLAIEAGYTAVLPAGQAYAAQLDATHAVLGAAP